MLAGSSFAKLKALVRVVFARLRARRLVGNQTKITVFPLLKCEEVECSRGEDLVSYQIDTIERTLHALMELSKGLPYWLLLLLSRSYNRELANRSR